ncbi:TetR/AcrR family transcriptional regulator [Mycobacterium sp. 852013-50091_SCH5140682]|uniref:TetR/AcrR family transcriptional regulator n=1 Tax=Mycobacterium sp. 852013-50091_SCH5140682 TaxID=1834109 RepID=UPI001E60A05F|nr:TetR/AcrR family transcriptional regulator [Mycobacterium sp. 852013-50091_SCH5140682]
MNEPKVTRTARRAAANREAIVDAAEALLVEGGVNAVTVDAVAERADVAIQTVYNRVGRRPEVLVAIAERAVEDNRRYMDAAFAVEGTPVERLIAAAGAYLDFASERPHQFHVLSNPPDEPAALQRIADKIDDQMNKLAQVLAAGVADGSFIPTLRPVTAAVALWSMMDGVLSLGWRPDRKVVEPQQLREIAEFAMATVLTGILQR